MLNIEEYHRQRQVRKRIRANFSYKLEQITRQCNNFNVPSTIGSRKEQVNNSYHPPSNIKQPQVEQQSNLEQILKQNKELKQTLQKLQNQRSEHLSGFKQKIQTIKQMYIKKIMQITEQGKKFKQQYKSKIKKLSEQIQSGQNKCKQIEQVNSKIQKQLDNNTKTTAVYFHQMDEQYKQKLLQFEKVLNLSTNKIKELDQQSNVEELVQAALSNNQLIQQIKQNAESSQKEIDRLFEDYNELLVTKQQIIKQFIENNQNKEKQIASFKVFQSKLNTITQKIQKQKQIYVNQNQIMSKQLIQIRGLLMKVMGKDV